MKRRYLLLLSVIPVVLALVFLIPFLKADTPSPRPTKSSELAELVETLKIWKLVDAVSPTAEQKLPLLTQFNRLEKLKMQYRQEHRQSMNRLKQLQTTMPDSKVGHTELQTALTHHSEVENEFIAERQKIMEEVNQILTVEQQAQFILFTYSYRQELRKALQTLIAVQEQGKTKDILAAKSVIR
jgi:hypothetical protein